MGIVCILHYSHDQPYGMFFIQWVLCGWIYISGGNFSWWNCTIWKALGPEVSLPKVIQRYPEYHNDIGDSRFSI